MIESTAGNVARNFDEFLAKVAHGETIRIRQDGRLVARMSPDFEFMAGAAAARIFEDHQADAPTAEAIAAELRKLDAESDHALAH